MVRVLRITILVFVFSNSPLNYLSAWALPDDVVYNTGASSLEEAGSSSANIRFAPCPDNIERFCGTVVEIVNPEDPPGPDVMPDGKPVIGYPIIRGLKDKGDGKFRKGKIIAMDESLEKGKIVTYDIKIDDNFDGTLKVKGCLGPICPRTMIWRAVSETTP